MPPAVPATVQPVSWVALFVLHNLMVHAFAPAVAFIVAGTW